VLVLLTGIIYEVTFLMVPDGMMHVSSFVQIRSGILVNIKVITSSVRLQSWY
jgi:hypothetical protein